MSLNEPVTKKIDLLSLNVISLVDRFCFLAPFNCRMTLEAKVPIDHRRSAYKNIKSIIESDEECEQFRDAWIEWVRSNPQDPESGDEGQPSKWMLSVYGDSDDDSGSEREMMPSAKPTGKGKRREVDDSSLAATAMKDGAGIRDDGILLEGTAGGLQDEDNAVAAAEGIARRAPKSPAKAAAPAAAGAAAGNGASKSPAKAAAAAAAGAAKNA